MLLTAPLLGFASARGIAAAPLLLLPALTLLFLARFAAYPVVARIVQGKSAPPSYMGRRILWSAIYAVVSGALLAMAIMAAPLHGWRTTAGMAIVVGILGLANVGLGLIGRERTITAELLGMAGLAAFGPMIRIASGFPADGEALGVGALAFAYFASSLALVRSFRRSQDSGNTAGGACLAAHVLLGVALAGLPGAGWLPAGALFAFLVLVLRAAWALLAPPENLKELGRRELGVSVVFLTLGIAALLS